ncbi:MAG: MAPEG family protein [Cypionkella sp.]
MALVQVLAMLAVVQFLFFGLMVGKARGASGLKAPAVTGDAGFERAYRVQMNTLEMLIAFFPALYVAALYLPVWIVATLATIYLVGRMIYWRAYVADPATRGIGFALSFLPIVTLTVLGLGASLRALL